MAAAYLWINAAFYVMFAIWQTLSPSRTAAAVGYATLDNSGRSEYLVIYGGLQFGLAAFFAWTASQAALNRIGVIFALCLYAPIAIYRLVTIGRYWPVSRVTLIVGALEIALLIGAIFVISAMRPNGAS
jgi:hypothetical protein